MSVAFRMLWCTAALLFAGQAAGDDDAAGQAATEPGAETAAIQARQPASVTGADETTDPTEPTASTEPTAATAPTDPTDPADPIASTEPIELPADLEPVSVFDVLTEAQIEEITVIGGRRARNYVDVQREIEAVTYAFYDRFNEVVVDDDNKVKCTLVGAGGMGARRVCLAGFQMKEFKARQAFAALGVYRSPPEGYLEAKGEIFTRAVVEAINEYPSLVVLAEQIADLKEEANEIHPRTVFLEKQAERERRRELLGPAILRAAPRRPGPR